MRIFGDTLQWCQLRSTLTASLELERARIGSEQAEIVADFISHDEFGLAHDQLVDALSDVELSPLEETQKLLASASILMGQGSENRPV